MRANDSFLRRWEIGFQKLDFTPYTITSQHKGSGLEGYVTQPLGLPLEDQFKALEQLQELDLKIDRLRKSKSLLPAALKGLDESVSKINTTYEAEKNAAAEIEKSLKHTRAALELNQDRIARANTKLEAVQNTQEFQAATKEIEQLKKLNGTLEEQAKKLDSDVSEANKKLAALESELEKNRSERASQAGSLSEQGTKLSADISALISERARYVQRIEPRLLTQYDRIRSARGGLGIAPTVSGRCTGCNMVVPPQLYNQVQRCDAVQFCPSCHRIIFVPVPNVAGNQATGQPESQNGKPPEAKNH